VPHRVMQLSPCRKAPGPGVLDAGGRIGRSFAPERQQERSAFSVPWPIMFALASRPMAGGHCQLVRGARERLKGLLEDHGVSGATEIRGFARDTRGQGRAFPCRLAAGGGLCRARPGGDFGTGRAGRPAGRQAAPQAQGRELPARGRYPVPGRSGGACRTWRRAAIWGWRRSPPWARRMPA
jgi:hypothetical protein